MSVSGAPTWTHGRRRNSREKKPSPQTSSHPPPLVVRLRHPVLRLPQQVPVLLRGSVVVRLPEGEKGAKINRLMGFASRRQLHSENPPDTAPAESPRGQVETTLTRVLPVPQTPPGETSLATGRAPRRDATSLVRDHTSLLPARGETSLSMYLAVLHTLTSREPLQRIVLSRQVPSGEVLHDDARGMNPRHRVLPSLQAHRNLWSMGHHRHHNCRVNADHGIAMQRHARTATRTSLTSGATWSKNICPLVYNHT